MADQLAFKPPSPSINTEKCAETGGFGCHGHEGVTESALHGRRHVETARRRV